MITLLMLKIILLSMAFVLGNGSWTNYLQMQKVPADKVLQIASRSTELNTHVGRDWLIAILAITGSILALIASERILYKLKNKQTDWRNDYK
jgi:TRAP-type C4-dicarboxylate transport system permease small subunit